MSKWMKTPINVCLRKINKNLFFSAVSYEWHDNSKHGVKRQLKH